MKRAKLNFLLSILRNTDDHILLFKPDLSIVCFNEKAKNFFGYRPEEILGQTLGRIVDSEMHQKVRRCFEEILRSDDVQRCDVEFVLQNGAKVRAYIETISLRLGEETMVLMRLANGKGSLKEMIERSKNESYKIEDFSEKVERYFKLVQKEAHIGIWEVRLDDMKVYWSDELYDILGLDKSKNTPQIPPISEMVKGEDKRFVAQVFNDSLDKKESYEITYRIVRPDGEEKYLDEHVLYLDDEDGHYMVGFDIDVTERERFQQKLLEQKRLAEELREKAEKARQEAEEANKTRTIFLSNISHEIKTLLNAILGYSQILKQEKSLDARQKRMVESILIAGGHLLDLINDILDITKMEIGKNRCNVVEFNLTTMFKSLYQIFKIRAENKNIGWKIVGMPKEELLVHTDKTKLFHILLNLVGNAIKFTDEGKVELIFRYKKNNKCYFEIRDTGIGIKEELQKKIFEPFVQNEAGYKRGGTGLGLAIAKSNVELLGGKLELESKEGKGTRFFFEIPCGRIKRVKLFAKSSFDNGLRLKEDAKLSVLIADDIDDNRVVLKELLEQKGIKVYEAKDGQEAVEIFKKARPELVFMDIRMPKKDGIEAAREIRVLDEEAKIVSLAASRLEERSDAASVFDDQITKPFSIGAIDKVFMRYFAKRFTKEKRRYMSRHYAKLSQDVRQKIIEAAQIGKVTELRKLIENLENEAVRERLERYLKNFELDKIVEELKKGRQ